MIVPSTDRFRPAPRESQTENVSVLSPANLGSDACFHLQHVSIISVGLGFQYSPSKYKQAKMQAMKQCNKENHPPRQLLANP